MLPYRSIVYVLTFSKLVQNYEPWDHIFLQRTYQITWFIMYVHIPCSGYAHPSPAKVRMKDKNAKELSFEITLNPPRGTRRKHFQVLPFCFLYSNNAYK